MLDAASEERRRALQRQAFAPGGRLTEAESAELRTLTERASAALTASEASASTATASTAPASTAPASQSPRSQWMPRDPASQSPRSQWMPRDPASQSPRSQWMPRDSASGGIHRDLEEGEPAAGESAEREAKRERDPAASRATTTSQSPRSQWMPHDPASGGIHRDLDEGGPAEGESAEGEPSAGESAADESSRERATRSGGASRFSERGRRMLVPLLAIVLIAVGFLVGRELVAQNAHAQAMTPEQHEVWEKLETSGAYDAGSLTLIGSRYGIDVWTATQRDGKTTCLLLRKDDLSSIDCQPADRIDSESSGQQINLMYHEDDVEYSVWAIAATDITGAPVVTIQREDTAAWDWRSAYDAEQLAAVERLEKAGFTGESLSIVGYDGDLPIWLHQDERSCVLVERDGEVLQHCGDLIADSLEPLSLTVGSVEYQVRLSSNHGANLTIERESSAQGTPGTER